MPVVNNKKCAYTFCEHTFILHLAIYCMLSRYFSILGAQTKRSYYKVQQETKCRKVSDISSEL